MKNILLTLFFIAAICSCSNAQSKEIFARSAMLNADEAYGNGNYITCLNLLKEAETTLGVTNSRIQYLRVKTWMMLGNRDQNNQSIWKEAQAELKKYFEVTNESEAVQEKYDEMVMAVTKIRKYTSQFEEEAKKAEEARKADALRAAERIKNEKPEFDKALSENTIAAYDLYILKYPAGKYVSEAREKKKELISAKWDKRNLITSRYKNGEIIPQVTDKKNWISLKTGAWCYYNNDPANEAKFGKLYNWYAVTDPRGLCPTGWHVPGSLEWETLAKILGGINVAGGKLKSKGITLWESPNSGASDEIGFSAIPGGRCLEQNDLKGPYFSQIRSAAFWWTSDDVPTFQTITFNSPQISQGFLTVKKYMGFSVRCIKD